MLLPLLFLLLSQAAVTATGQQQQQWSQEACAPFSCGLFHDISHPFRRTTDPPQCGDRMYELTCDGDKATISIGSTHYLITQLSYKSGTIRLVDPKFASGSCGLPSQSLSPSDLSSSGFDHYQNSCRSEEALVRRQRRWMKVEVARRRRWLEGGNKDR
ncbi:hypothetical protein ZIOFF_020957 [Zingiber officinale]|uniref:Wall-associated receptor kinase galacturonan-binding domain-containing protein n=1 Tax=Zingiber officinale TaxID=94328 RepID=A0A8J5L872_ZINOF|nr:hypothetical protein ZIOFF_020957 [Zingiber officinale]